MTLAKGIKDTADYEQSEEIAIADGKSALQRVPWLFERKVDRTKGFFFELEQNDAVHPDWYAIHGVDGVGTKLFLSCWSGDFTKQPIDGIAMSANDICTSLRAYISAVNLYFAMQTGVEEHHMGAIMEGFVDGLDRIRVHGAPFNPQIGKIETASLDEMIALGIPNKGWDVGVTMLGYIRKGDVPLLDPKPGHPIVGVSSTGMHSNGYTGGRHALLKPSPELEYRDEWRSQYKGRFELDDRPDILRGKTVLEAMQEPTALYTREAALVGRVLALESVDADKSGVYLQGYGVNITGNGLKNFNRCGRNVAFHITDPLPLQPIHELLIQESGWSPETAYKKQNQGMGFAYVLPSLPIAERVTTMINKRGEHKAKIVGEVRAAEGPVKTVMEKPYEGGALTYVGYAS